MAQSGTNDEGENETGGHGGNILIHGGLFPWTLTLPGSPSLPST